MRATAASFAVRGESPARIARALSETATTVGRPAGGLVFAGGSLAARTSEVAAALARTAAGFPLIVVGGAGVLTEREEIEGEAAAVGLVWSGGECAAWTATGVGDELCLNLARTLRDREERGKDQTALVFVRPTDFQPHALESLNDLRQTRMLGAGTVGEGNVYVVGRSGEVSVGSGGALALSGVSPPLVRVSPACRLLMPLREITEARASMVLSIEGEPALEVLSAVAHDLVDQPLVFVALSSEPAEERRRPSLVLRPVQGVDPSRHGIMVSDEVKPGMRVAFAVRDAPAAKADLQAVSRELEREAAGAAPRFGIYVNCAGRGVALYQSPDVDVRILRSRFADIPWVGMQSSFEIAPHAGKPTLQLYSGVIGLFTAPS
jgi:small ligand-binding sensory domain FIST